MQNRGNTKNKQCLPAVAKAIATTQISLCTKTPFFSLRLLSGWVIRDVHRDSQYDSHPILKNEALALLISTNIHRYRHFIRDRIFLLALIMLLVFTRDAASTSNFYTSNKFIFERLNNNTGLSSDEVNTIYQTSDGYIWFCSNDGLMRYDAYEFDVYKPRLNVPNSFNSKAFVDICEDQQKNIWLATKNDGVNVFNPHTGEVQIINSDHDANIFITNNNIKSVFCDSQGKIWIGCNQGINRYDPSSKNMTQYSTVTINNQSISPQTVRSILEDSQGNIWFGTWNMGIIRYNPAKNEFTRILLPFENENSNTHIRALFIDSKGQLWISIWEGGLHRVDHLNGTQLAVTSFMYNSTDENTISGNIIHSINEDREGNIWLGSPYGLDIILESHTDRPQIIRKHTEVGNLNTPSSNVIFHIFKDQSGIMWLATLGDGVNRVDFDARKFESFTLPQINPQRISQSVHSIFEGRDGDLLIGVRSLGLLKYDRKTDTYLSYKKHPVFSKMLLTTDEINTVFSFMYDREGYLWIGTRYNGLYRINEKEGSIIHIAYDSLNQTVIREVNCILEDSQGQVWIGTDIGLYKFKWKNRATQTFSLFRYRNDKTNPLSISGNTIKNIYEDKAGNIWIGTDEKGLSRIINPEADTMLLFKSYRVEQTVSNGLTHNDIYSLFQKVPGILWIGTGGGGLVQMDVENETFRVYTEEDGLHADAVYDIIEDVYGTLWLSTNGGICKFDPQKQKGEQFENFTSEDGLNSNILIKGAVCQTKDGYIFIGGHKGFNSFHPDDIIKNQTKPRVKITQVNVFNTPVYTAVDPNEKVTLTHKDYSFTIEFTALSYSQSLKNMYAYQMEGFDDDWQYTTASNRRATYSNLRQGDYIFKVKAANNSGVWSDAPFTLRFRIKPAPYLSWWAYTIYILVAILILIVVYQFLLSREKIKKDLEIEQIGRLKSEKINLFKLRFYTNISHELLTPLAILSATVEGLKQGNPINYDTTGILQRNIQRLIKLIQQLLVFRKIETENLKLSVSKNNLSDFVKTLCGNFAPLEEKKDITLNLHFPDDELDVFFDEDKIDKILHNLLSNAFKYTSSGGKVTVTCSLIQLNDKTHFQLQVSDTGKGIPPNKLDFIFDRYARLESDEQVIAGTGIGLELTKRLVELHNGEIQVASELGIGTTFTIQIPAFREAYLDEQIANKEIDLDRYRHEGTIYADNKTTDTDDEADDVEEKNDGRKKLLLIEDNHEYRHILKQHFSKLYAVIDADNGKTGLAKAKKFLPDIVVSDIMMPEMNGIEFCTTLKNTLEISHIPVILLTAKTDVDSKTEGYETGADSYIEKPVELKMLEARIKGLIRQREKFKELFKTSFDLEPSKISVTSLDEKYITRVKDIVEKNIDNPEFSVTMLVNEMSTSNSMLYRKISSLTGMSPNEFIKIMRLKRAAQLLSEKKHNVSEVAYITGFNNQSYFGVCFKKQFGVSPSEFVANLT